MLFEIGVRVLLRIDEAVVKLWKVLPYSSLVIYLWPLMDTNNVIVHPDFLLYAMQRLSMNIRKMVVSSML